MFQVSYISIIGFVGLLFRLWLVEFEVNKELDYRKRYLSRFMNYYFFMGLMFENSLMVFNLITVTVLPFVIIAILSWDRKWFKRYHGYELSSRKKFWLVVERSTLHVPLLIGGIIPYFTGISTFILGDFSSFFDFYAIISFIVAGFIIFVPYILFDIRWSKKHKWPTGKYMLMGMFVLMIIMYSALFISEIF